MIANWVGNYSKHRQFLTPHKLFDLDNRQYTYRELIKGPTCSLIFIDLGLKNTIAWLFWPATALNDRCLLPRVKLEPSTVPYNIRLSAAELVQLIQNEEPQVLFYEDTFKDKVMPIKEADRYSALRALTGSSDKETTRLTS